MSDIITIEQKDFAGHPLLTRLRELHDVPSMMRVRGTLPHVTFDEYGRATPRILTIVGSRKNTTYGRHVLEKLVASLRGEDVIILSGLALGIDGLAHKNALANSLITLAIPGSGLDPSVLYPRTHANLAEDIIAHGGVLLSELDDKDTAATWTFPMRNRIMAALSDAILIIEAEEKSGTLITARQGLELGRDIGAVPGEIFSSNASGTNMLIKEGAYPITSSDDLFALLHLSKKEPEDIFSSSSKKENNFTSEENLLLSLLREPLPKDTLFVRSGLSIPVFLGTFSSLELRRHVEETFGEVRRMV